MKVTSSLVVATLPAILLAPGLVAAQEAAANPDSSVSGGLTEIVVTAERRSENVLTVPLSIQAETGEQLQNSGITTLTDLQFTTPGYYSFSSAGFTQLYIRGIGNNIFSGADPSVATFIDDVPRIYGTLTANFVDVDRVEVLKGAQGGLYGRNATGGVLNIITRQPDTKEFSGNALVDYGEMNTVKVASYANMPVNDKIAVLVAAEWDSHDGYITNVASPNPYTAAMFPAGSFLGTPAQTAAGLNARVRPPSDLDNQNFYAADAKIAFTPIETLKFTFAGDYNNKHDNAGNHDIQQNPQLTQGSLFGILTAFGFKPNLPAGFEPAATSKFSASVGDPIIVDTRDWGQSLTAVWNAPGVDVTSISAERRQDSEDEVGTLSGNVPIASATVTNRRTFFYQELRAASTWAGPFHLLAGATYLNNQFHGIVGIGLLGGLAPGPTINSTDNVHNQSVYAQIGYDLTQDLNLTVSGRYIHEINHANFTQPISSDSKATEHKFLPSATLSYKLDDGVVYARWAEGFKAGGVNPTAAPTYFPDPNSGSTFQPETVNTYEIGYRQALLDKRLQVTSAVFYNSYHDLQYSDHANPKYANTVILAIVNGGSARTYGAEGSLDFKVADPIVLGVNAGYLHAKYINFVLANNPVLANFDLSGQQMINSPKLQLSFRANLDQPINDRFHLVGNLTEAYIGTVLFAQSALPGVVPDATGPGYWLTNLRLGVNTANNRYGVAVFARNLFNREYYVYGGSNTAGNVLMPGDPRVVGGEFTAQF